MPVKSSQKEGSETVKAPPDPGDQQPLVDRAGQQELTADNPPDVLDIRPMGGGETAPEGNPPQQEGMQLLPLTRELVEGMAEATANVHTGRTLSSGGGQQRRAGKKAPVPKFRPAPYRTRGTRSAPVKKTSTTVEGSKVKTTMFSGPYIPWQPSREEFWEAHNLLRGAGCFYVDNHITCLPHKDERRVGNRKWMRQWERCEKVMSSQGEARAHALTHLRLAPCVVCVCPKAEFSNAKTLGHHLREFHNVSLKELRDKDTPANVLENPRCSIKPGGQ